MERKRRFRCGTYYDGIACADNPVFTETFIGICAIKEDPYGAYAWSMYDPATPDGCPPDRRFFTCP